MVARLQKSSCGCLVDLTLMSFRKLASFFLDRLLYILAARRKNPRKVISRVWIVFLKPFDLYVLKEPKTCLKLSLRLAGQNSNRSPLSFCTKSLDALKL